MIKDKYRTVDLMKHKIMKHIGHPDQRVFLEILKNNPSKPTRPLKATEEPKPALPEEPKAGPPAPRAEPRAGGTEGGAQGGRDTDSRVAYRVERNSRRGYEET